MSLDPWVAFQIVAGALVAGFIQGMSGFAFSLVATSLWAWTIEPQLIVPTVIFGSFLGQVVSIGSVRSEVRLQRIGPFLAGGLIGVPVGAALLPLLDVTLFRLAVGGVLAVYAAIVLLGARLPVIQRFGRAGDLTVGAVAGVMGGASAMSGPPMTLWCAMRGWTKDVQRATYQSFFVGTQFLAMLIYLSAGMISWRTIQLFWLVGPPILLASWVGSQRYKRLSDARFTQWLFWLLLMSGVALVAASARHLVVGGWAPAGPAAPAVR